MGFLLTDDDVLMLPIPLPRHNLEDAVRELGLSSSGPCDLACGVEPRLTAFPLQALSAPSGQSIRGTACLIKLCKII